MPLPRRLRTRLLVALTAALLTSSCAAEVLDGGGGQGSLAVVDLSDVSLRVGSKETTEQVVLSEIARLALREAGADVGALATITGSVNVRTALTAGQIDLYWEYTGTAWSTHLQREITDAPREEAALFEAVRAADRANGVAWIDPAPLNNSFAIAVSESRGAERGLDTLTGWADLVRADPVTAGLCGDAEFLTRDDGLPGIESVYGFDLPDDAVSEMQISIIPGETARGERCLVGVVNNTDGAVVANDLALLADDQDALIDYTAAVTVRQEILDAHPQLVELFAPVSAALTSEVARSLNERADVGGELPEEVAESWMRDQGFIS